MGPIKVDFDGIFPRFDLSSSYRQILMAFAPFSLMGPIKVDFDGILLPFHLWGSCWQILMAFCPLFTDGAHHGWLSLIHI